MIVNLVLLKLWNVGKKRHLAIKCKWLGSLDTFQQLSLCYFQVEFVCFLFPLKSLVLRENDDRLT